MGESLGKVGCVALGASVLGTRSSCHGEDATAWKETASRLVRSSGEISSAAWGAWSGTTPMESASKRLPWPESAGCVRLRRLLIFATSDLENR